MYAFAGHTAPEHLSRLTIRQTTQKMQLEHQPRLRVGYLRYVRDYLCFRLGVGVRERSQFCGCHR